MSTATIAQTPLLPPSFATLDQRAKDGDALSVVFFGGSLTWGANASDPNVTSYRGRMMQYLREQYPNARWQFHDAAIGGTGSNLGIFRLERDVLAHNPDLVFLDFMANDNYSGKDNETRSCYETLVRTMVEQGIAVQQMYFGFKYQFTEDGYNLDEFTRRTDYQKLTKAYNLAEGDIYPLIHDRLKTGKETLETLWPFDGAHPGNLGYGYFFEAARLGFEQAIAEDRQNRLPDEPLFGVMSHIQRIRLAELELPAGWSVSKTYRTSLWYDGLSSRWMDDVVKYEAKDMNEIVPLKVEFVGQVIGFFGESNHQGLDFTVTVDGTLLPYINNKISQPNWPYTMRHGEGNLFAWKQQYTQLSDQKHVLEIMPLVSDPVSKGTLRIESLCAAIYQPAAAFAEPDVSE